MSFAQERLWFLDQLSPGTGDYNVGSALWLRGEVVLPAFEQALREVLRRHEVLRTAFRTEGGAPVQAVMDEPDRAPLRVDFGRLGRHRQAAAEREARREALRPFDLARGPLLRASWLRLRSGEHLLVLTCHHIVCDGWSIGVIARELVSLYRAFAAGQPSPLAELPAQYADFAEWQREQLSGERLDRLLDYWRRQLQGAPAGVAVRGALTAPAAGGARGAEETFVLAGDTSARLAALWREEGATAFVGLAALWSAVLHVESGQEDLCLGANAAQRGERATEGLVGFFVNQIVLRIRPRGGDSSRRLLRQVRDVAAEAHGHQELPFEKLVEALCPERGSRHSPLFETKVDFQDDPLSDLELGGAPLRCDLRLTGWWREGGQLGGALSYDRQRYERATAARLVAKLAAAGDLVAAAPDLPLAELAVRIAEQEERRRSGERERLDRLGAATLKSARRRGWKIAGETPEEPES